MASARRSHHGRLSSAGPCHPDRSGAGPVLHVTQHPIGEPLRHFVSRSQPLSFVDALELAIQTAKAVGRLHALGLAHGYVRWDALVVRNGEVVLCPPPTLTWGLHPRVRDVQAMAGICLELLESSAGRPEEDRRWRRTHELLARAATGAVPLSLTAGRLATRLAKAKYHTRPAPLARAPVYRRVLAAVRRVFRAG